MPHKPCPGPRDLISRYVRAGDPPPADVFDAWTPGFGYCVSVHFQPPQPGRQWTDEQRATVRKRNLTRRIEKAAPLFVEELVERELKA